MTSPKAPTQNMTSTNPNLLDRALRSVVATANAEFLPYNRYGVARDDMEYLPLGDGHDADGHKAADGSEIFLLRLKPGTVSTPHRHTGGEAFYVLEGEITDCDGVVFRGGDYVCYQPDSCHFSHSEKGCKLLVILGGRNAPLD